MPPTTLSSERLPHYGQLPSVLLVDDHPENLLAFEATLEPLGLQLVRARSAAEALQQVAAHDFAVIVLDVEMPGMNGVEVARRIKQMAPPRLTPIIFVTALDHDRRQVHDGYESGAVDYLFKPLDPDVLRQKVAAFVRLWRDRQAEELRDRQRYADLAEGKLRHSEARYRALFESLDEGFCIVEMLFDADGAPVDYRFLETNPAFVRQSGLANATGRRVRELIPGIEQHWIERYARVALTGEASRFQGESSRLNRWFDVFTFRVGRPEDRHVAMLFTDVTAAKEGELERERLLRALDAEVTESVRARRHAEHLQHVAEVARDEAERAHRRTARLQSLTAALAAARTVEDVASVVVAQAVEATGASTGMLALREAGAQEATIVRQTGLASVVPAEYQRLPLSAPGSTAKCLRTGEPQWVESRAALYAEHPEIARYVSEEFAVEAVATVPLLVEEVVVGAMSFTFAAAQSFPSLERELFLAVGRQTSQAIERAQLIAAERAARAQAESAEQRLTFLAEASARLAGSLDVEATLRTIADLAVPALADLCVVEMLEEGGVRPAVVCHAQPEQERAVRELLARWPIDLNASMGAGKVLRTGEPELISDITEDALADVAHDAEHLAMIRAFGFRSSISAPLADHGGRTVASLSLISADPARRFGEADLAMAMEVARRAGVALASARLMDAERAASADAESASRAKSLFLANMSHELRTPLNAIAGHVQLIEMEIHGPVSDAQREALVRVDRAQRHLLGLINDVLNFARLEAGRVEYDLAPVLLRDVLADVLPMVESQLVAKALQLECSVPEDLGAEPVHLWADRDKLGQVLLNLLSNAVKFTPQGGAIGIALIEPSDSAEEVVVRVSDTGVGIPEDKLDAVFEAFVQVRSDYTRQVEGTGLGLAISRDLARGMGGDLRVTSALGEGSTFELMLRRVTTVGGAPVERRSRPDRRNEAERRRGVDRRG